eukprot:TRINITY_DN33588_c0_g1_i1.p1 TRINITY_DN33588_c0_g1~~TRINITY_DN33588_c0_g1_i1.p1  ORF type:complete len:475 (+),score=79.88 TRINITY_DN33588_c0_g1_i1:102-1526(+)
MANKEESFMDRHKKFHRGKSYLGKAQATERHHQHVEQRKADPAEVSYCTAALFTMFGMSAWWVGNSIFAQMPLLVAKLPEGKGLGTQISMMMQVGNVFSIGYKAIEHHAGQINPSAVVMGMHQASLFVLMLLAMFWDSVDQGQSLPLLLLAILGGGLGCLSDVTYYSLIMRHPPPCTKATGVGMSVGNFLVMGLSIVQTSGRTVDDPRFGVSTFFVIAAFLQLLWGLVTLAIEDRLVPVVAWAANKVSTSLSERLGLLDHRLNPMHDKAKALLRADSPADEAATSLEPKPEEHPGPDSEGLPAKRWILFFEATNFMIYACTYSLPPILPYVAGCFPSQSQQAHLLLYMMTFQSIGDVIGRTLAPTADSSPFRKKLPLLGGVGLPLCMAFLVFAAVNQAALSAALTFGQAMLLLPSIVFVFFFSRGMLVTAMFLQARGLTDSTQAAEHLASTMGLCGQMGALSANLVIFAIVNFL